MIIDDPCNGGKIDVTGWELDRLDTILADLAADVRLGSERNLSDDEIDVLTGEYGLPEDMDYYWWHLGDDRVQAAIERYREIVEEAIYARDLPSAMAKMADISAGPLSANERAAYDRYQRSIAERPS